jgi:ATP-binding cassette subfamily B (MDR/TAP) protein 1
MATGLCFALDAPIEKRMMAAYDKAAVLAEEVFSTITTIHSFWLQPLMARRYDSHLAVAEREAMKKCVIYGVLFSTQFFCIYSGYALAFWQGTRMYTSGDIREPGKIVT